MNSSHVLDLYGIYISSKAMIVDTERSARPFQPIRRQVLHKVIHRLKDLFERCSTPPLAALCEAGDLPGGTPAR
jgi:hypothetical protein